jgi:response regulator RpfG family c-di-GMP phosphodiesterase
MIELDNEIQEISPKVLIVDDEENILRALKRLLMNEDIEVLTATSGEKALNILNDEADIGLIISDQRMPGLSGVDFLEQAKKIHPLSIRIILTGYSDITAAIDAINRGGAAKYLTKPWKDEEIILSVREACQRYALIQKNKQLSAIIKQKNEELKQWSRELEIIVQEQTMELSQQNDQLRKINEQQDKNFKSIIASLSSLIELRDTNVKSHSRNVSEISSKVALEMGLSKDEAEIIFVAALLHDIGKIGLADSILDKEAEELSPEGWKEYSLHPVRGQTAIDGIEDLRKAGILIRHHHECYDGTGFPDRLKGSAIPIGSRIIAMADYIDRAMGKISIRNTMESIFLAAQDELGKNFDPQIFPYIRKPATDLYTRLSKIIESSERELEPGDLKQGMVLSRDVKSGTGLLLLSKGVPLDSIAIQAIKRYYRIDPPPRGVFVWTR